MNETTGNKRYKINLTVGKRKLALKFEPGAWGQTGDQSWLGDPMNVDFALQFHLRLYP